MANPYAHAANMAQLEEVLKRHGITVADANDLVLLQGYEIVFIADDSGSMTLSSVPKAQRRLGAPEPTRWDELCGTVRMLVELATCFDPDGIDLFFLNRPPLMGVRSRDDPQLNAALSAGPRGSTPLTETLRTVLGRYANSEKPVLLVIATDGVPNGGPQPLTDTIVRALNKGFGPATFKFQIMACTDDDDSIGWLNQFDRDFEAVDVTDDYHTEKQEVLRAERAPQFNRGDWLIKALLGPISSKFDGWDEPTRWKQGPGQHQAPQYNSPPPHPQFQQSKPPKKDGCCSVL